MGIDFRIKDFAYPLAILKLKRTFNRNQWLGEEALREYQLEKLRQVVGHAYQTIPYYQKLFRESAIVPDDIKSLDDLKNIPCLTKDLLRLHFDSLLARDANRYSPTLVSTSGTTGERITFYTDKPSNVLEFVYYWRSWGWAGYRLGDPFAELTAEYFVFFKKSLKTTAHFDRLSRRLTLNSLLISRKHLDDFIGVFRKFKPLFLKGMPSNLYMLALVFQEKKNHGISFKAIFSQGENLLQYQKDLIEKVFSSKVYDSYGHMERTVAISQCPQGTYHINSDYGIAELARPLIPLADEDEEDTCVREVVGTSLHNWSMPLIRYRTGDFVKLKLSPERCPCGRSFPSIVAISGRQTDAVITPDKRAVTGLYTVFDRTPGIIMGQIVQEDLGRLVVKIVSASEEIESTDAFLIARIREFLGTEMDIHIEHTSMQGIKKDNLGKFKCVISHVPYEKILE